MKKQDFLLIFKQLNYNKLQYICFHDSHPVINEDQLKYFSRGIGDFYEYILHLFLKNIFHAVL